MPHPPAAVHAVAQQMLLLGLVALGTQAPLLHCELLVQVAPFARPPPVHVPLTHDWPELHLVPQVPQLLASVLRLVVHPALLEPLQLAKPALQV